MILYNGRIHTMDDANPAVQAIRITDGRIEKAGTDSEILSLRDKNEEMLNLEGAAVYPGLIDSHLHILDLAISSRKLDLGEYRRRADVLSAICEYADSRPADEIIDAVGFNENLWDDRRLITRKDLDEAAHGHPVRMTRICGHMAVGNSAAISRMGISDSTQVPEGGEIRLEEGIFSENALNLLYGDAQDKGKESCKQLLFEGMSKAADAGLTGIWTDDFYTGGYSMHSVYQAYTELEAEHRMPVRVVQQCALANDILWNEFLNSGYFYGKGTDMYRLGPRKLYSDGSLGARTACLTVPYADAPDRSGVFVNTQAELNRLAAQAHAVGMPFIVHAIGDAAVESVLDAIEYARKTVPGTDNLPSGIVHCQITGRRQLERIRELHAVVYAQPVFVEYDQHICRSRVGEELEKTSYNWKTMLKDGVCISSGSDCPIEPLDPAKNIYCAVTRKDFSGYPENGWVPEQCLTVEEAIRCHTVKAAEAVGYENRLGKIKAGYLADLTVYPEDFFEISPDDILNQKPLFTMVGGVIRKCRG